MIMKVWSNHLCSISMVLLLLESVEQFHQVRKAIGFLCTLVW